MQLIESTEVDISGVYAFGSFRLVIVMSGDVLMVMW